VVARRAEVAGGRAEFERKDSEELSVVGKASWRRQERQMT